MGTGSWLLLACLSSSLSPSSSACTALQFGAGCADCQECELGEQFLLRECAPTQDALCANCSACSDGEYPLRDCYAAHDTVCRPCPVCALGLTFRQEGLCGPESEPMLAQCQNCTQCPSAAVRACNLTHDTQCSSVAVVVALTLASQVPASAYTAAMLQLLGDALAQALGIPCEAVPPILTVGRRSAEYVLLARFRVLLTEGAPDRIRALNLDAVATASGLPIRILAISSTLASTSIQILAAAAQNTSANTTLNATQPAPKGKPRSNTLLLYILMPLLIFTCLCSLRVGKGVCCRRRRPSAQRPVLV